MELVTAVVPYHDTLQRLGYTKLPDGTYLRSHSDEENPQWFVLEVTKHDRCLELDLRYGGGGSPDVVSRVLGCERDTIQHALQPIKPYHSEE